MKDIYKNPAQVIFGLLISWLVTYGIVFAQPLCCGAITDKCIPAFNRVQIDETLGIKCKASLSHRRNLTQLWIAASEMLPKDVDAKSGCCENEPCVGFNLTFYNHSSTQQCPILQVKKIDSFHATFGLQNLLNLKSQSIPLPTTSIYILTKSIIC